MNNILPRFQLKFDVDAPTAKSSGSSLCIRFRLTLLEDHKLHNADARYAGDGAKISSVKLGQNNDGLCQFRYGQSDYEERQCLSARVCSGTT